MPTRGYSPTNGHVRWWILRYRDVINLWPDTKLIEWCISGVAIVKVLGQDVTRL